MFAVAVMCHTYRPHFFSGFQENEDTESDHNRSHTNSNGHNEREIELDELDYSYGEGLKIGTTINMDCNQSALSSSSSPPFVLLCPVLSYFFPALFST